MENMTNNVTECGIYPISAFGPPCSGNGDCVYNAGFGRNVCVCHPGWEGLSDFLVTTDLTDCQIHVVTIQVLNGLSAFFMSVLLIPTVRGFMKIYAAHRREAKRRFHESGQSYRIQDNQIFFSLIPFMAFGFPSLIAAAIAKAVDVRLKIGGSIGYTIAILLFRNTFFFAVFYYQVSLVDQLLGPFEEFADFTRENRVSSRMFFTLGFSLSAVYIIPFVAGSGNEFDRSVYYICAALMGFLNSVSLIFFYVQGRRNMKAIDRFQEIHPAVAANPRLTTVLQRLKTHQGIAKKNAILQTLTYGVIMGCIPYMWNKHDYIYPIAFCFAVYQIFAAVRSLVNDTEERERQERLKVNMDSSVNVLTLAELNQLDEEKQQDDEQPQQPEQDDSPDQKGSQGRFEISVGHETMLKRFGGYTKEQVLRFAKPFQTLPGTILLTLIYLSILGLETAILVGALPRYMSFISLVLTVLWSFPIAVNGISIPALSRVVRQVSFWLRGISGLVSMICLSIVFDLDSRTAIAVSHLLGLFIVLSSDALVKETSQRMKPIVAGFVTVAFFRIFLLIQFDWLEQRTDVRVLLRPFEHDAFAMRWSAYSSSRDFCFLLVTLLIAGDLRHILRHPEYAFHLRGRIKLKILKLSPQNIPQNQNNQSQVQDDIRFRIKSGRVLRPILALGTFNFSTPRMENNEGGLALVEESQVTDNPRVVDESPTIGIEPTFMEQQIISAETATTILSQTTTTASLSNPSTPAKEEFIDLVVLREVDALVFALFGKKRGLELLQLTTHPSNRVVSYFLFCGPIVVYSCFVLPGLISPGYSLVTLLISLPIFQSLCLKSTVQMKRIMVTTDFKLFMLLKVVVFALFGVLLNGDIRIIALFPLLLYTLNLRLADARCVFLHPPSTIHRCWITVSKTLVAILGIAMALAILFIPIGLSLGVFVNINASVVLFLTSSPPEYPEAISKSDETILVWSDAPRGIFANIHLVQAVSDVLITILLLSLSDLALELLYRKGVRVHLRQLTSPVFFRYVDFVDKEEDLKETVVPERSIQDHTSSLLSVNDVVRAATVESNHPLAVHFTEVDQRK